MPVGEAIAEVVTRVFCEVIIEGVAYFTGYLILYPFTFGRVREKFSANTISFVGLTAWVVFIVLIFWQPWVSDEAV